jgi:CheY-like chemotaxis protein
MSTVPQQFERDVLIVEDDSLVREELTVLLRSEGYTVEACRDGQEALELMARSRIGVVLLDLMMPVMSGWDLAAAMRRIPELADVPVMTITAVGNVHRAPPGPVFLKPLNVDSLLRGVARCVGARPASS